ncbi:MAG: hypothetical protein ACE5I1_17135, partial [bacterium]
MMGFGSFKFFLFRLFSSSLPGNNLRLTLLFLACLNGVLPGQSTQQSAPNTLSSPTYILLEKVELDKVME